MSASRDPFMTPDQPYRDIPGESPDAAGLTPPNILSSSGAATPAPGTDTHTPGANSTQNLTSAAPMASTYQNVDAPAEPYQWQEKYSSGRGRRKWVIWGGVIGVLALIAIGVGVGVSVSNNHKGKTSNNSSNNSPDNSPTTSGSPVPQTDPNDPSTFIKDPRLKQSFYAMAYTPEGSVPPNCTISLPAVIVDIQLISQLTTRLRLYGSECNQSAMVLEAIKQTKVNMQIYLGNYIEPDDNGTSYTHQRDVIVDVIKTYGIDNILGVTVGNEFMLNYLTAHGSAEPNSAVGDQGAAQLVPYIQDMITTLAALNLAKHLPVGNSDAGAFFNTKVLEAVEFGMANVHPWFGNVSIDQAAAWTYQFFQEQNVAAAAALSNHPTMFIAETGWPSASSDAGNADNGASAASIANLQTFLDTYVCQATKNNSGYFYFEVFDENWKEVRFGGVEGHWGLFNTDKTLKNITIPTCS